MKNGAHLKINAWIPTTRVAGIVCPLVTMKQCLIVNALIGRSTAFPASTSQLCFDIAKVGEPIANIDEEEVAEGAIPENNVHGLCKISDEEPSKPADRQKSRRTWNTKYKEALKHPDYKFVLYLESKTSILQKNYWLTDSENHARQLLLKKDFHHVDGLHDSAVKGSLVVPATPEFVQILKTGSHWVYLSTILTTPGTGTVKIFDSTYQKPNSIAVEHAPRMLIYPGSKVAFINEKFQRQVGASDCGLFYLAFATDLCHGLDHIKYDQGAMRQHYVNCLENGAMVPFPRTRNVPFHRGYCLLLLFTAYVDLHIIKICFCAATNAKHGIIPHVFMYQHGH